MNALNTLRSRVKNGGSRGDPSIGLMAGENAGPDSSSSHEAVQVEPKTYFANERTFIQWISAALLLLTVSSIMMGSGDYNGTSSVIAFCALILVAYAAFVYFRRVRLLQTGEAYGYLDFLGPSILAAGVGLGVFIVFADAIKGSEFLPWGDGDGRRLATTGGTGTAMYSHSRHLAEQVYVSPLEETTGVCHQHSLQGLNLLEYQPQDIVVADPAAASNNNSMMVVATPQSLVAHFTNGAPPIVLADDIPNVELASIVSMPSGQQLLALSTGPTVTELIQFSMVTDTSAELISRHVLEETATTQGSIALLSETNKLLVSLDGRMYTYEMPGQGETGQDEESSSSFIRTSTLNTKVLDQGSAKTDPITAMEHVHGITYLLRSESNTIQAWDMSKATLVDEIPLPAISTRDQWAGLALQVVTEELLPTSTGSNLRSSSSLSPSSSRMVLHMSLDSYPPQLWTFSLQQHNHGSFSLAPCDGSSAAPN